MVRVRGLFAGRVGALGSGARLGAKTRYRMPDAACIVSASGERIAVRFDAPQWAPTPGQYLVLYDGDVCLGGGVIAASAQPPAPLCREATARCDTMPAR